MRLPNLNTLRMFDAAARHLTFADAAAELHLTQGAVAQQVRKLEADLGLALFRRHARGLSLTDAGRSYSSPVRQALALIEAATATLRPATTQITLSVTPSLATKWLVPRLSRFGLEHPQIALNIRADETLADLRSDGVDLAIRQTAPPFADDLCAICLAKITLCAVASPEFAKTHPGTLKELASLPLISDSHPYWQTLLASHNLPKPSLLLQFNQTALAMDAASNGQGIALAPALLVADDVARGKLMVVWQQNSDDDRGFYLVHRRKAKANPSRETVKAWLMTQAQSA